MPKSDLERFFERERLDFAAELEPHRQLARDLNVFDQAVLAGWCEIAHVARRVDLLGEPGEAIREDYAADADGYEPDDPDPQRLVVAIYFGATINGLAEDMVDGDVRIDELCGSLEQLVRIVEQHGGGHASVYGAATFGQVVGDLLRRGFEPEEKRRRQRFRFPGSVWSGSSTAECGGVLFWREVEANRWSATASSSCSICSGWLRTSRV